jgi:hypothetical protein
MPRAMVTYVDAIVLACDRKEAAEEIGIEPLVWCLNDDGMPWSCGMLEEGHDPHDYAIQTAESFGVRPAVVHGTSWAIHETYQADRMLVVAKIKGLVLDEYPQAIAVRAEDCGPEYDHEPTEKPRPSYRGLLFHTACTLKGERRRNGKIRVATDKLDWEEPLEPFEEVPARMYGGKYRSLVLGD